MLWLSSLLCSIRKLSNVYSLGAKMQQCVFGIWSHTIHDTLITLTGHSDQVRCCTFFSRDQRLLSGSDDTTLRVWSLTNGKSLKFSLLTEVGYPVAVFLALANVFSVGVMIQPYDCGPLPALCLVLEGLHSLCQWQTHS